MVDIYHLQVVAVLVLRYDAGDAQQLLCTGEVIEEGEIDVRSVQALDGRQKTVGLHALD